MKKYPYEAGGFAFQNTQMRDKTLREIEGIRYVKEHTNMDDPEMVLNVYCQMIDQNLFETPAGYHFLCEMQEYLMKVPYFLTENIPPIPVSSASAKTQKDTQRISTESAKTAVKTKKKVVVEKRVKNAEYKMPFRFSLTVNVILGIIVALMFAITATSGNINIVNYENALIQKYETWEQKLIEKEEWLKEREQAVRELEDAAGVEQPAGAEENVLPAQ